MVDGAEGILEKLRTDFPTWKIWRSHDDAGKGGDWYATRDNVLTGAEMYAGLAHTLVADTPLALRRRLEHQADLTRQIEEVRRRMPRPRAQAAAYGSAYL